MVQPLYITDLDGTLLRSDLKISEYTKTVMNQAIDSGFQLTYCTARTYTAARHLLEGIHFQLPVILLNGVVMVDPIKHQPIICNNLPYDIAAHIIEEGKKAELLPIILNFEQTKESVIHFGLHNKAQCNLLKQLKSWHHPVIHATHFEHSDALLSVFFIATYDQLHPFQEWITATYGSEVDLLVFEDSYNKGFYNLQISNPKGNKGHMVEELATYMHIPLSETIVFGDHVNDLPMFAVAGHKVAVGNAHGSVINLADECILSNDEDGIAKYFGELIS